MEVEGQTLFPAESIQDWVSYADHIAVATVVSAEDEDFSAAEREKGEGYAAATALLRIDRVLWSAQNAPELPSEIEMEVLGTVLAEGETKDVVSDDAPSIAEGDEYLVPFVQVEFEAGPEWWPLAPSAQLAVANERVAASPWASAQERRLEGRGIPEIAQMVRNQSPNPIAAKFADLRPQDRVVQVLSSPEGKGERRP